MKTLEELRAIGAFVDTAPVVREIKFSIGENEYTASIWVRRQSLGEQDRMFARVSAEKDNPRYTSVLISTLVSLGENGEQLITVDDASALHPNLARAMTDAIEGVNGGPKG